MRTAPDPHLPPTRTLRAALAWSAALACGASLLGCDSSRSPTAAPVQVSLSCTVSEGTVVAGTTDPVAVTLFASRGESPAGGERITFLTASGDVVPDVVITDFDGTARASYFPPAASGTSIITATATSLGVDVTTSCSIVVTPSTTDPGVTVRILSPESLAGLEVTVTHDPTRVRLTSAVAVGPLTGSGCQGLVDAEAGSGRIDFREACQDLTPVAGSAVASLSFDNLTEVLVGQEAFGLTCRGYGEDGSTVPTFCVLEVVQQ